MMSKDTHVHPKLQVENNAEQSRFELSADGELSVLEYSLFPGELILLHTGVPESLRERGIASQLTRTALEFARSQRLVVVARCPFASDYIERHPEFGDLLKPTGENPLP